MNKYIRYKNYQMFYTEDNWKHFEVLKLNALTADEETNSDLIVGVRLRHELGEQKASVILKELEKIRKDYNLIKKDGYGHAFEIFAIATLYNIDYTYAYDQYIVKGSFDGKIDAVYWKENNKIEIYQIKLDKPVLEEDLKTMKKNHNEFCRNKKITSKDSSDLEDFYKNHASYISERKKLFIKTISINRTENNITPNEIFELYFNNQLIEKNNNIELVLRIPDLDNSLTTTPDHSIYAYFDLGKNIINQIMSCDQIKSKENLYKLFFDNVRGQLKSNKNMKKTIEKEEEHFVLYNNGITITGEVEFRTENDNLVIKNPIISNGQQTIWNLLENKDKIDHTMVLVIIKNNNDSTVKSRIARYTNEQKTIKSIDLLSLDQSLRDLQKKLFQNTNFFLELNSSGTKNYTKIIRKLYDRNSIITIKDFCRVYHSYFDEELGSWKNHISTKLEPLLDKDSSYDFSFSKKVCQVIKSYKDLLATMKSGQKKNDLQSADVAFMFIMLKYNKTEIEAKDIIEQINHDYFYASSVKRKSKLIDIYKSNDIVMIIKEYCE